jgi:hypothetical protein
VRFRPSRAFAVSSLVVLSACAVSKNRVCRTDSPGWSELCDAVVKTEGFGVVVGRRHVTIGWMRELLVELTHPDACHVVLVVERPQDVDSVSKLLSDAHTDPSHVCLMSAKGKTK